MKVLLGARTDFSLGYSILSPKDLIAKSVKAGYKAVAIADVGNVNALPALKKAAKEHDVRLIIGTTYRVVDDINWRRASRSEPKRKPNPFFMPKLYAKNEAGFVDIMKLLSLANDPDHFYYEAQIDLDDLLKTLSPGNVIMTTGDASSLFQHKDHKTILEIIKWHIPSESIYAEIVPDVNQYYDRITIKAFESGLPTLISRPAYYAKGEAGIRNTLSCVLGRNTLDSMFRQDIDKSMHILSPKELLSACGKQRKHLESTGQKLQSGKTWIEGLNANQDEFLKEAQFEFREMEVSLPVMAADPFKELVALSKIGWAKRIDKPIMGFTPAKKDLPIYIERLKYELLILKQMGFESYFLLVHNIVSWSKERDIMVGPGRGSAGGSLVSFLLGITDIDPIRFDLIFERFINPERLDLPDIDLDFMSTRKQEVHTYLIDTWGEEYVAGISNYTRLQSSSALRSVAKAHGLTESDIKCSKLVPKESGTSVSLEEAMIAVPEIEQFALDNPEIWREACGLQGAFRSYGRHAAGVVVAGVPLTERAVVETRHEHQTLSWDKRIVESFGLIKLDILGLSTLDVLAMAKQYVREESGEDIEYTALSLDDKKVMESFARAETVGVFQFEGGGMRHLLKELAFEQELTFEDLTVATALFRPGPIESGLMDDFVRIRQGVSYENYPHPSMRPALEETKGVLVYQEQVMKIGRDLSGFSMAQADHLRKAMGKKDPAEMAKMRSIFVSGAMATSGMAEETAGGLFDQIEKFAGYGFNKSHSVEYSVISYWCMYMKVYHPAAFFAAALTALPDEKSPGLVKEAATFGISIVPPDINISTAKFEIRDDVLYAPFQAIKGCSEKGATAILTARFDHGKPFDSKEEFVSLVNRRACNVRVQDALDKVGAFASIASEQPDATDPSRLKDQKELIPGLMSANVKADRKVDTSVEVISEVQEILLEATMAAEKIDQPLTVMPKLGKNPKIVVVVDYPNWSEASAVTMGAGDGSKPLQAALKAAGLTLSDIHLTALVKCPKPKGGEITNEMIRTYSPFLDREIAALNPPVILTLGSKSIRHFIPEIRGKWDELLGQVHYLPALDASLVVGLSPGMVFFDKSKQKLLNDAMKEAALLTKEPIKTT